MLCGAGEEEEEETPEPREEPHCQKKYRAVCKLLRCRPIKHFLRSLITDYVAVKNQKLSNDDIKACVIGLLVRLNDKLQYQLCLWSVAALSACCTDLCVCQWPPFQHVVPNCVSVTGRPFSMLY